MKLRRGYATIMALVSLMLVGTTVAILMTRLSMEATRTRMEIHRVQQEQLEIARSMAANIRVPAGE